MNDHRIDVSDIQPRLNDSCGNKHIHLTVDKAIHDTLQFPLTHLTVGIGNLRIRYQLGNLCRYLRDLVDTVVYIIHLTIPRHLALNSFPDHLLIVLHDVSLDRHTVMRRLFQHTHVPDSDQAHMQSSRNRRRGQSQHVHVLFHLFNLFLMTDTKPLFLVNDQQTQILADHIFGKDTMCSDHDIHRSFFQTFDCRFLLLWCPETAEQFHINWEIFHTLCKRVVMLLRQNRSRYQINNLFILLHRFERCPDCHLSLAKADISTDQPIHDLLAFHIRFRCFNGKALIVGLLIWKHFLKFPLPYGIRSILKTFFALAHRIQFHQFLCDLSHCCLYPVTGFRPFLSAQTVQFRFFRIGTRIFLDQIQLRCQHIQIAAFVILDLHIIPHGLVDLDLLNTAENSKTVIFVYDIIPRFQFRKALDPLAFVYFLLFALFLLRTENIRLRQHHKFDIRIFKSAFQFAIHDHDFSRLHQSLCIFRKKCV